MLVDINGNSLRTKPEVPAVQNGVIAAVAETLVVDVSDVSVIIADLTSGTFSGVNCAFEISYDNQATWMAFTMMRTTGALEPNTGALSAAPAYAWKASVVGATHWRIRCTARTSGSQNWTINKATFPSEPAVALTNASIPTSVSAGTALVLVTAASTNLTMWATSGRNLHEFTAFNPTAAIIYVKLYNKATAPVVATDVPVVTIPVAAGGLVQFDFGRIGKRFTSGVGLAVTGGPLATDATAVGAGAQLHGTVST